MGFISERINDLIKELDDANVLYTDSISDGNHTFEDLYNQRLYLSAALFNTWSDICWKSRKHSDGNEPFGGGWFIVGCNTPKGQFTYHYRLAAWDLFKVPELERAPEWDGHTSFDVDRLLSVEGNHENLAEVVCP